MKRKLAENSGKTAPGRPFKPGKSGNPGGRPKVPPDIREQARAMTPDALRALREVALKGRSESARVAAAVALLNRAWGTPMPEASAGPEGVPFLAHVRELLLADGAKIPDEGGLTLNLPKIDPDEVLRILRECKVLERVEGMKEAGAGA